MKTTICILSYNNPSMTDRLFDNLNSTISTPHNTVVYDNGSDADKISKHTTHRGLTNCRMVGGFNEIIKIVNKEYTDSEYFWFFTNDCYFVTKEVDVLDNMLKKFNKYCQPFLHLQFNQTYFSSIKYERSDKKKSPDLERIKTDPTGSRSAKLITMGTLLQMLGKIRLYGYDIIFVL